MGDPGQHLLTLTLSDPGQAGKRLDLALARALPELSRSRLQALMRQGHVSVDGEPAKPRDAVRLGAVVAIYIPQAVAVDLAPEAMALTILFEDEALIVLDKPAGLVVHPGAGHDSGTLVHGLLAHCPTLSGIGGELRPGIVHRLDKDTSGCMVIAKNDLSHQRLSRQFADRSVRKRYLAVVQGRPQPASGRIENSIGRHPSNRQKMAVVVSHRGKPAITEYEVLHSSADGASLVECRLLTGRTHQIRVHLHSLGHPLLGDQIYGRSQAARTAERMMLHSWKLGFEHPRSGDWLEFEAKLPDVFDPWLPPDWE